jgi:hypothetical protein
MIVIVHLKLQSEPITITDVRNAYQKGSLYCVMLNDRKTVRKWPIEDLFEVKELAGEIHQVDEP